MAKLDCHGHPVFQYYVETGGDGELTNYTKTTVALMSDGVVLKKRDVRFRPDSLSPKGRHHSYGWKRGDGKIDIASKRQALRQNRDKLKANPKVTIEIDLLGETPCHSKHTSVSTPVQSSPVGSEKSSA